MKEWEALGALIVFLFVLGSINAQTYKIAVLLGVAAVAILINSGLRAKGITKW